MVISHVSTLKMHSLTQYEIMLNVIYLNLLYVWQLYSWDRMTSTTSQATRHWMWLLIGRQRLVTAGLGQSAPCLLTESLGSSGSINMAAFWVFRGGGGVNKNINPLFRGDDIARLLALGRGRPPAGQCRATGIIKSSSGSGVRARFPAGEWRGALALALARVHSLGER